MSTQTLSIRLAADGKSLVATLRESSGELKKFQTDTQSAGDALRSNFSGAAQNGIAGIGRQLQTARTALLGFFGVQLGAGLIRQLAGTADAATNLNSKLRNVTSSEEELGRVRQATFAIAQRTRQEYGATAELYARLTRATADLSLTEEQRLRITETTNKAMVVSGASTQESSAAIIQLSQALASGTLRGDEFNSIAEQAPIIMDLVAQSLGKTRGELRAYAAEGKLTAEVVTKALLDGGAQVDAQFANMSLSIGGASTQLSNAMLKWVGDTDRGVGASQALAGAISAIAKNFDVIAAAALTSGTAVALYYGVKAIAAITGYVVAQAKATLQSTQLAFAEIRLAAASEAVAIAQRLKTASMTSQVSIIQALTAQETALAISSSRLAVGVGAAGAGMVTLGKAGASLFGALGGWITVAAGVVYSLYQWTTNTVDLSAATAALNAEADKQQVGTIGLADALRGLIAGEVARKQSLDEMASAQRGAAQAELAALKAQQAQYLSMQEVTGSVGLSVVQWGIYGIKVNNAEKAIKALDDAQANINFNALTNKVADAIGTFQRLFGLIKSSGTDLSGALDPKVLDDYSKSLEGAATSARAARIAAEEGKQASLEFIAMQKTGATSVDQLSQAIRDQITGIVEDGEATDKATAAKKNAAAGARELARDESLLLKVIEDNNTAIQKGVDLAATLADGLGGPLSQATRRYHTDLETLGLAMDALEAQMQLGAISAEKYAAAKRDLSDAAANAGDVFDRETAAIARQGDVLGKYMAQAANDGALVGLTDRQRAIAVALRDATAEWQRNEEAGIANKNSLAEVTAGVEAGAARLYDFTAASEASQTAANNWSREWQQRIASVGDAIGDLVSSGLRDWKKFGNSLVSIAKQFIAQIVSQFAQARLLQFFGFGNVSMGGGGAGFAQAVGAQAFGVSTGSGGGGGGFGFGQTPTFGAGQAGSWMAANPGTAGAIGSWGGALGGAYYGSTRGGGGLSTGLATGTGAIAGYYAGGALATTAIGGATAGAAGAAAAGSAALSAIPIVGWIALAIIAIDAMSGGKVFGTKFATKSSTQTLRIGADGGTASAFLHQTKQGSLFSGLKKRDKNVDAGDDAREAAQKFFEQIKSTMTQAAQQLGVDVPPVIDAALRTVNEYDKKGKVKATKIFVDVLGRSWQEETAELAAMRINAEAIISVVGQSASDASTIAERWRGSAEQLSEGAGLLLNIQTDISRGYELLGESGDGALTHIVDFITELQHGGETLPAAYMRIAASAAMLDQALGLSGVNLDATREDVVRFAAGIVDLAGGVDQAAALYDNLLTRLYSPQERTGYALGQATTSATTQFAAAGLDLSNFTGEDGFAKFRELWEQQLPQMSAEQTVEYLRLAQTLGQLSDLTAQYNALLGETALPVAQTGEQLQAVLDILASNDWDLASASMTTAERAIAEINRSYDEQKTSLLGNAATVDQLTQLEKQRTEALEAQQAALAAQRNEILAGNDRDLAQSGMTSAERAIADINARYDEQRTKLEDLGATTGDLTRLDVQRTLALQQQAEAMAAQRAEILSTNATDLARVGMTDYQRQLAEINDRFNQQRASLVDLGATTAELTQLENQRNQTLQNAADIESARLAAAGAEYRQFIENLWRDTQNLSDFQRESFRIEDWQEEQIAAANAHAQAAGAAAASEQALALIERRAAQMRAAALAQLRSETQGLFDQLYGGASTIGDNFNNGIDSAAQAADEFWQRQREAIQSLNDYLDSMLLGDLSALTPEEQLAAAWQQLQDAVAAGDATRATQLSDVYLRLLRASTASGDDYNNGANGQAGFWDVRALLEGLRNSIAGQTPPEQTGNAGSGSGQTAEQAAALIAADRLALAVQFAQHLHDLAGALNTPILQLAEDMGLSMRALASDLGVNLEQITGASVQALAGMASMLGINLTELTGALGLELTSLGGGIRELAAGLGIDLTALTTQSTEALGTLANQLGLNLTDVATAIGISLGSLADSQSLLNQALGDQINSLPAGQRDLLRPLFDAITNATNEADANAAIDALNAAVNLLAPDIRNQLAPYLADVFPADALSDLDYLSELAVTSTDQLTAVREVRNEITTVRQSIDIFSDRLASKSDEQITIQTSMLAELQRIANNSASQNSASGLPSYAVGTGRSNVQGDQVAQIHHGEKVIDAQTTAFLDRYGIRVTGGGGGDNSDVVAALLVGFKAMQADMERLKRAIDSGSVNVASTVAETAERNSTVLDRAMTELTYAVGGSGRSSR